MFSDIVSKSFLSLWENFRKVCQMNILLVQRYILKKNNKNIMISRLKAKCFRKFVRRVLAMLTKSLLYLSRKLFEGKLNLLEKTIRFVSRISANKLGLLAKKCRQRCQDSILRVEGINFRKQTFSKKNDEVVKLLWILREVIPDNRWKDFELKYAISVHRGTKRKNFPSKS